ncbi:MAG: hypothetical protein AB7Q97_14320 [Gammaproteobacteria bacterium]
MDTTIRGPLAALLLLLASSARATDEATPGPAAEFKPARFSSGPSALVAHLAVPAYTQSAQRIAAVYCQVDVWTNGEARTRKCFAHDQKRDKSFCVATSRALKHTVFEPAARNGEPIPVQFLFRVLYFCKDKACRMAMVPNVGFEDEEFGTLDYESPQPILHRTGYSWIDNYIQRQGYLPANVAGHLFTMSVPIDESGRPHEPVEFARSDLADMGNFIRPARSALLAGDFVPGHRGGRPVPMRYHVPLIFLSQADCGEF